MLTDTDIAARVAAALPVLGPTRAGWLREALSIEPAFVGAGITLWACRAREVLGDLVVLVEALRWAAENSKRVFCDPTRWVAYCCHCKAEHDSPHAIAHAHSCPWAAARRVLERYEE